MSDLPILSVARAEFDKALREFGAAVLKSSMAYLTEPSEDVATLGQVDVNLAMQRLLGTTPALCAAIHNAKERP